MIQWTLLGLFATLSLSSCGTGLNTGWPGTRQFGAAGKQTRGTFLATDSTGAIIVSGFTTGGLNGNTLTGTRDAYVLRYNASGVLQWTFQRGSAGKLTSSRFVGTDSGGSIYMGGYTTGTLDGTAPTGPQDIYLIKLDSSGVRQFTRLLGTNSVTAETNGGVNDSAGNVYLVGSAAGGFDGNTATGPTDLFVTKFDSTGTRLWTRQLGVALKNTYASRAALDSAGNVYVTGSSGGALDGQALSGDNDAFLIKYNSSGVKQWTRLLGAPGGTAYTEGLGVSIDSSTGAVYVAGTTTGALPSNTLKGTVDYFVAQYDTSGTRQWVTQSGVSGTNVSLSNSTAAPSGGVIVTGDAQGSLLAKYSATGSLVWTSYIAGTGSSTASPAAVAKDSDDSLFVTGYTTTGLGTNALIGVQDGFVMKYDSSGNRK